MPDTPPSLKRNVGLLALTLYGVGGILGSGVYGLIGKAAGQMGSAVWLAFLVSMVAAGLTGLSYASLGSRYPRAAGASYVAYRAYKSGFIAYVVGLSVLASGLTSMATAARVFGGYFSGILPTLELSVVPIAIAFSLALLLLVTWGIRESLFANGICTIIELSGLLFILVIGAQYLGSINYFDTTTVTNPTGELNLSLVLSGAVLTFYSFIGFEDLINVAEEVKNPRQTIPRAVLLSVSIASCVYIGIALVAVSVVPAGELSESSQPLVTVVAKAAPWFPRDIFSFVALFAVANTALLNFIMGSRLIYGMSRQGLLPTVLGQVHKTLQTPFRAIVVVWCLFIILLIAGDIATLAKATSVLLLFCFIVVNLSLVVLKKKETPQGTFEVPTFVPILGALVCFAMLIRANQAEYITAGSLLGGIIILYFVRPPTAAGLQWLSNPDSKE
jgi:APA family basic amino acid/polyamine antiporter